MNGCGHRPRADGEDEVCLACQLGGDLTRHLHDGYGGCSVCDALRGRVRALEDALGVAEEALDRVLGAPARGFPGEPSRKLYRRALSAIRKALGTPPKLAELHERAGPFPSSVLATHACDETCMFEGCQWPGTPEEGK